VLLLLLLAAPLPSRAGSNHSVVSLTLRGPASTTAPNFLGVNIDTASLYQGYDPHRLDFTDSGFVELGAAFAAAGAVDGRTTLRIGGSTADDSGWGAAAAAPGIPHQPSPGSGPNYSQHVVIDGPHYPTACACCAGESIVEEVSIWKHWDRNFGALDSMDIIKTRLFCISQLHRTLATLANSRCVTVRRRVAVSLRVAVSTIVLRLSLLPAP